MSSDGPWIALVWTTRKTINWNAMHEFVDDEDLEILDENGAYQDDEEGLSDCRASLHESIDSIAERWVGGSRGNHILFTAGPVRILVDAGDVEDIDYIEQTPDAVLEAGGFFDDKAYKIDAILDGFTTGGNT